MSTEPYGEARTSRLSASGLSRRTLLQVAFAAGAAAVIAAPLPGWAADTGLADFVKLSEFLTGYQLDPVLGQRYLAALTKRNAQLPAQIGQLLTLIDQAKLANMDAFLAQPALDAGLKAAATKIVSAWYLGIVGEAEDAELISYAQALMYRPTQGLLVIPTYGGGPASWGPKPGSL